MKSQTLPRLVAPAAIFLAAGASSPAAFLTIDDFSGGPHLVSLTSLAPPQIATGTFGHGAAVGGVRDIFVISQTVGIFASGVAFGTGGYASFTGKGMGGIIWDGSNAGAVDANGDKAISPSDFEYGLSLDLISNCSDPSIRLDAFADLPGASVLVFMGNSPTDYAIYDIPLTTVAAFDTYWAPVLAPTITVGAYDPSDVKAVAMIVDGTILDNLDVRASLIGVECPPIPEASTWVGVSALGGICGWTLLRRRQAAGK